MNERNAKRTTTTTTMMKRMKATTTIPVVGLVFCLVSIGSSMATGNVDESEMLVAPSPLPTSKPVLIRKRIRSTDIKWTFDFPGVPNDPNVKIDWQVDSSIEKEHVAEQKEDEIVDETRATESDSFKATTHTMMLDEMSMKTESSFPFMPSVPTTVSPSTMPSREDLSTGSNYQPSVIPSMTPTGISDQTNLPSLSVSVSPASPSNPAQTSVPVGSVSPTTAGSKSSIDTLYPTTATATVSSRPSPAMGGNGNEKVPGSDGPSISMMPSFDTNGVKTRFPTHSPSGSSNYKTTDSPEPTVTSTDGGDNDDEKSDSQTTNSKMPSWTPTSTPTRVGSTVAPYSTEPTMHNNDENSTPSSFCNKDEAWNDRIVNLLTALSTSSSLLSLDPASSSGVDYYNSLDTPQQQALDWLLDDIWLCSNPHSNAQLLQRFVLVLLYYSTGGPLWTRCSQDDTECSVAPVGSGLNKTRFLDRSVSDCEWAGVDCNATGIIHTIRFESNNLKGTLPTEIGALTTLTDLTLQQGFLSGTIPSQVGFLSNLSILDLDYNSITGPLPSALTNLQQLDLNHNALTGTIPSELGRLTQLDFVQLSHNPNLTGTVPSTLGLLSQLRVLDLQATGLTGTMPQSVCQLRSGALQLLVATCASGNSDETMLLECSCCTYCAVASN